MPNMTPHNPVTSNQSPVTSSAATGPRTPEGKARSSRNALKHGLRSRDIVLPGEDPAEWEDFRDGYIEALAPEGRAEHGLALRAAQLFWRLLRIAEVERKAVAAREQRPEEYLPVIRKPPANADYHFPNDAPDMLPDGFPAPAALRPIVRYEAHLGRQFDLTLRELHVLQDRRRGAASRVTRVEIHGYPGRKSAPAAPAPPPLTPPTPAGAPPPPNMPNELPIDEETSTPAKLSGDPTAPTAGEPTPPKVPNELPSRAGTAAPEDLAPPKVPNGPPADPQVATPEDPTPEDPAPPKVPDELPIDAGAAARKPAHQHDPDDIMANVAERAAQALELPLPAVQHMLQALVVGDAPLRLDRFPGVSTDDLIDRLFESDGDDRTLDHVDKELESRLDDDAYQDVLYQLQYGRDKIRPRFNKTAAVSPPAAPQEAVT